MLCIIASQHRAGCVTQPREHACRLQVTSAGVHRLCNCLCSFLSRRRALFQLVSSSVFKSRRPGWYVPHVPLCLQGSKALSVVLCEAQSARGGTGRALCVKDSSPPPATRTPPLPSPPCITTYTPTTTRPAHLCVSCAHALVDGLAGGQLAAKLKIQCHQAWQALQDGLVAQADTLAIVLQCLQPRVRNSSGHRAGLQHDWS